MILQGKDGTEGHMLQALLKHGRRDIPEVSDVRLEQEKDFLEKSKGQLEALEVVRVKKFKNYKWRKRIGIPIAAVGTPILGYVDYWLLLLQRGSDDGGAGVTLLFLGALYWWVTKPRREYAKAYKQEVLPEIAKLFGNFMYMLDGRIALDKMKPSKILPHHDRYDSEDYFTGSYKDVNIEFSEVDFKQKRRNKNRTYYVSVFKGLAILLDMKSKKFYGHTILDRNKSKLSEWFKEKSSKLKRANLVDPKFEGIYDVYTNDQVEARYLVDPVMMEHFTGLNEQYDGKSLMASFYDSKLLILIESPHNYFEPADLEIPATDPRSILSMKKEIEEILSLIDRLSLYDPMAVHAGAGEETEMPEVDAQSDEQVVSDADANEDGDSDIQTYSF